MSREEILEIIGDDEDIIFYDGLDDAIIGIAERINLGPVVAYDTDKALRILAESMEVDESELYEDETKENRAYEMALEHFNYNIISGYIGEKTPIFIRKD